MRSTKVITINNATVNITLTGTSGTASITGIGGLIKTATFATNLTTTASNFVTTNATAYLAVGIGLTSSGAVLTFAKSTSNTGFDSGLITNQTGDLSGTFIAVSNKYYVGGSKRIDLLLRRANHVAGSSAFAVKASLDSEDTVTPTMTDFNLLIDNATNTNAQTLTRVNGATLSADGDAFLQVDPRAIANWLEISVTHDTDGTHSGWIICEY